MAKKTILGLSLAAALLLSACGGQQEQTETVEAASPTASASATPTPEPTTAEPTAEETPAEEAAEEPAEEEPAEEEQAEEEPAEEEPEDPYAHGQWTETDGVSYFVPDSYEQDATVAQAEVFSHQYTHYDTAEEALGRLMVGSSWQNEDDRAAEELADELAERLTPAWNIQAVGDQETLYREDGTTLVRQKVTFSSGQNPGYIWVLVKGQTVAYTGLLTEVEDEHYIQLIEESFSITR